MSNIVKESISIVWLRRDLRINDNMALNKAIQSGHKVAILFIFDDDIIDHLEKDDPRISFIYKQLRLINASLNANNSSLICKKGKPLEIWKGLLNEYNIVSAFVNRDYEPYAIKRDKEIFGLLKSNGISLIGTKDQVVFEKLEIAKNDGKAYTVYTPYKNKWLSIYKGVQLYTEPLTKQNLIQRQNTLPELKEIGFVESSIKVPNYNLSKVDNYSQYRDYPALEHTSRLSVYLRFGTVSIREIIKSIEGKSEHFLNELIWREFYMQILYNFPYVVTENFRAKYNHIPWRNNDKDFDKWCKGLTGYPIVDAGMRELNKTGFMHNRVRMITASFLCKHLLIDWRWGEAYFASKLLDYELASNNGGWQWASGTGCDAAPYFRVFNPTTQQEKFDKKGDYIKKWIPELNSSDYPSPMVDHKFARKRAIETYKKALETV